MVKYKDDAERPFSNPFSRWLKTQSLSDVCKSAWENLNHDRRTSEYIYSRGIQEKFRYSLGIGYMDGWFTIPIFSNKNALIGAVARVDPNGNQTTKHKYTQPHGQSSLMLYAPNWKLYERSRYVILCAGPFDAITLAINGVMAFSSLSGKTINPVSLDGIRKKIYIWLDQGEENEARILASRLGWRGKMIKFNWPEKCKDINEVWVKYPELLKEKLHELS